MAQIEFIYKGEQVQIQCNLDEKLEDIIQKFIIKTQVKYENIILLYNGKPLTEDKPFNIVASEQDKSQKRMKVLVTECHTENDKSGLKKSKYIICPTCGENILITIKNFKVCLSGCKNGHKFEDIPFKNFESTQFIDESKIKCELCQKTKDQTYQNKFYICLTCKINLCPLCESNHDKSHYIIDYTQKNITCLNHGDNYNTCCDDCKKDMCASCEKEHQGHKIITYGKLMPNISDLQKDLNNYKKIIIEFKDNINEIIKKLNNIVQNIDNYFNVYTNIINNFVIRDKNYIILQNINYLKTFNDNFMNYINEININKDYKYKISHIIRIPDIIDFKEINKEDNNVIELNQNKDDSNFRGLSKLKKLKTFKSNLDIERIIVLNDGRLLVVQNIYENNDDEIKEIEKQILTVYNVNKDNICDIEHDLGYEIYDIIQMNDGKIIISFEEGLEILRISEKSIEKIKNFKLDFDYHQSLYKLSEKEILLIRNDKEFQKYLYEKDELKTNGIFKLDFHILDLILIKQNEIAIYGTKRKGKKDKRNENAYISFYDKNEMKEIETLSLGEEEEDTGKSIMILIDDNNLIVNFNYEILVIDINTRKIISKFELEFKEINNMINFDKNHFIIGLPYVILLYSFDKSRTHNIIRFEDNKAIKCKNRYHDIIRYQENKLIIIEDRKNIVIYG